MKEEIEKEREQEKKKYENEIVELKKELSKKETQSMKGVNDENLDIQKLKKENEELQRELISLRKMVRFKKRILSKLFLYHFS